MVTTLDDIPLDTAVKIMARAGILAPMMPTKMWYDKSEEIVRLPALMAAYLIERSDAYTDAAKAISEKKVSGKVDALKVAVVNGHADVADIVFKSGPGLLNTDDDLAEIAMSNRDIRTMAVLYKHGVVLKCTVKMWMVVYNDWEDVADWLLMHDERAADTILYHALCEQSPFYVWKALNANADVTTVKEAARYIDRPRFMHLAYDIGVNVAYNYAMRVLFLPTM